MAKKHSKLQNDYAEGSEGSSTENENETVETPETPETTKNTRTAPLIITFSDKVEKNFGVRATILDEYEVNPETKEISAKVYLCDGTLLEYKDQILELTEFHLKGCIHGLVSKAKASCASAGGDMEKVKAILRKKFYTEYPAHVFVERSTGGEAVTPFTQLELVYAYMIKVDPNTPEGYQKVKEFFAPMSKEDRAAFKQTREWRLAYNQLDREKLEAEIEQERIALLAASAASA